MCKESGVLRRADGLTFCEFSWQVSNPTTKEVTFDAVLDGPGLLGEPAVTLGPGESRSYEAIYSPLVPGKARGYPFLACV